MASSHFRNGPFRDSSGRFLGRLLASATAVLMVPLLGASQSVPQPKAVLSPASLSVSLAHDGAPTDLTATLSNAGSAALTWRIASIRDVSAETAPAAVAGPIQSAKLYAASNLDKEIVDGEIIVGLKDTSAAAAAAAPPASFLGGKCKVKREMIRARRPINRGGLVFKARPGRRLFLVTAPDKTKDGVHKAIEELKQDPKVAYAEPNYRVKAVDFPNDPDFPKLYGMHNTGQNGGTPGADIHAPEAWDTYTGSDNVVVGIIDTGIDYLHPDLADNIWTNPGEIPGNGIDDDGNGYIDDVHGYDFANHDSDPMDDHFHGTHVAGTIAGVGDNGVGIVGVAWKAKLAALKFLDAGGSGTTEGAIEAVAYANAMGFPITSNSWGGGGFSQALKDVIDAGGQKGYLFVAAAGNNGSNSDVFPSYPAAYESDNIISVAATDNRDQMAFFSNFGPTSVDLGAPGVDIYSAAPGGNYQYLSGTSMATPHVSGAAALLKSYNPQMSYVEIKAALLGGVDPIPALAGKTVTGGRLNVAKALSQVTPPWLTMAPKGPGSLEPGAAQVLTATVNPANLIAGTHRGIVTLATNDPATPNQDLEVVATVSGCKSLALSPDALDFGPVWRTTSRKLTVTLTNACNDTTLVSAVESPDGEFAAATALPLRVPPFGKATLQLAYGPVDLGPDSAVLTVRSNAVDHPALSISARGNGVEPPAVSVSPDHFDLTLDPAEQATRIMTVRNTGGDVLNVSVRVSAKKTAAARQAGPNAAVVPGPQGSGPRYAPAGLASVKPASSLPPLQAAVAGLKVLYLTTFLPTGGSDQLSRALRSLPNVASLDVVDGGKGTPNLDFLQGYDVVLVASDFPWSDPALLGNTLADYVDKGGSVGLMVASIANTGRYGLQGRITDPAYMPIRMSGPGRGGDAVEFADHPITAGVKSISCAIPIASNGLQGNGIALGRYASGFLVGAVNPDKPVVALNVFPEDFAWGGDFVLMVSNTLDYLAGAGSWLKADPRQAVIPPGQSADFTLSVSAEGQLAGDHESDLEIKHNAPSGNNPLVVPFLLHVRPLKRLALTPPKIDFGSVMIGNRGQATVVLANAGNQATTVASVVAQGDFSCGLPVPFQIAPFGNIRVPIQYAPTEEGNVLGSLVFSSDAADNPSLRLALRGQGLPAPLAALEPESLSVSLAYNAAPKDLTSTLANAGRGVLQYRVAQVRDLTPPPAGAGTFAVQADRVYAASNYDRPAVPGELIVGLQVGKESLAASSALAAANAKVSRMLGRARSPAAAARAWKMPRALMLVTVADSSPAGIQKAIAELKKDANVAYVEPNYRVKAVAIPNDPDFPLLYGMHNTGQNGGTPGADIHAPEAWDTYTGSDNVVVGIIDTGIDYLHPDLADNIWTNPGEIPGNGIDDDGNGYIDDVHGYDFANHDSDPMDDHFHGTHVAGTIAGVGNNGVGIVGVAWKAKLAALKFLDAGGSGTTEGAIEAVAYANAMGFPITSNSWGGGGFSQALKDVIDAGGQKGYLFVAAAGNNGSNSDVFPSYPAAYESDNIISVAATDNRDQMAFFSNFGPTSVDLGAPGVDIYSAAPGGNYQYLSGTSMATPHVSGAAALLKSYNPQMSYVEIKAALLGGVDPIPALAGNTVTGGRLNVAKALAQVTPPWLTMAPKGPGSLEPGAAQVLTATVNPAGLVAGTHLGLVVIATNDPLHPTKELKVSATVSGCRSLSVTPSSLDFGTPWLGTSKRLALTLKNACNDFVTVSAVESPLKPFAAATALPLRVPPFGTAVLEIAYTPDDLKADKTTLTVRSDAQDHPALAVPAKGNGVKPPALAASPLQFAETLDPAETKADALKISNSGGDTLKVSLAVRVDRKAAAGPAPKLTAGAAKNGARYARTTTALRPTVVHPLIRTAASGMKVLYLTTFFMPDSAGDSFVQGIRGLPQVSALDVVDGTQFTPNADFLQAYDAVVVSADYPWADAAATGDALADYVDNGGRVALMVAAIASGGGYELLGRMGGPDYMPIVKDGPGFFGTATTFAQHPITAGLASIQCSMPTMASSVQGGAFALGQYDNGALLGAVHADKPIVALNVFPGEGAWSGDLILMMSNTLDFFATFRNWVKADPAQLAIAPGKSATATLGFDAAGLAAGQYTATLSLAHNAPSGTNPVSIPVSLTVRSKRCLAAAPAGLDFGKIWTGRDGSASVDLVNACNMTTTVNALSVSGKTFATSAAAPLSVAPFSKATVQVTYVPDDTRPDKGELSVASDAQDRPQIKVPLTGTGVLPPAIAVRPAALSAVLNPGITADQGLEISNSGGDTLRVKLSAKAADPVPRPRKPCVFPGHRSGTRPLAGAPRPILPHASPRAFHGQASGLKVLYLHTLQMPDSVLGDDFAQGMRGLSNVASLDLFDARFASPNADYLRAYDIVVVASDWGFADAGLVGDALADYVDAGGRVVLTAGAFYLAPPTGLAGRIAAPEYLPILPNWMNFDARDPKLVDHPINAGVRDFSSLLYIDTRDVQGAGQPLGNYSNGALTGAYNDGKPIVALNVFTDDGYWSGDVLPMMGNTFAYLKESIAWMKPSVRTLDVPPGKTKKIAVTFNTANLAAADYFGALSLKHNAPVGPQPLDVPATLTVRAQRCLSAAPASLDFGKVWRGGSALQTVALANRCNEATRVESIRSSDPAFAASDTLPLTVPAFSQATVRIAFSPKDLKTHRAALQINSDAQDNRCLTITASGLGIRPPQIAVAPASFSESVDAGAEKTDPLTIRNSGGDSLRVLLSLAKDGGGGDTSGISAKPALVRGRVANAGVPHWSDRELPVSFFRRTAGAPAAKADGLKVLYVNTVLPDTGFEDGFVSALRGLPEVGTLDLLNVEFQTPDAAYLAGYDEVIVASGYYLADPVSLGDALADYVDQGGRVCLMTAAISDYPGLGLAGRISSPDYLPMVQAGPGKGGPVAVFEDHPINAGVAFLDSWAPTVSMDVQGDGQPLGRLESGALLGAYNATKPVVALNVFPVDGAWDGDLPRMMENTLNYLTDFGGWIRIAPRSLTVAPGGSAAAEVTFDGRHVAAGIHTGNIILAHNVPDQGPVVVPATLTVAGRRSISVSTAALDFGDLLIGQSRALELVLGNTGNLPVTVSLDRTGSDGYSVLGAAFPLTLDPGNRVRLQTVFAPAANGDAPGELAFSAEGAGDPVRVSLSGRGLRPADLAAVPAPSPLRFSVAAGAQASGTLRLSDRGDEGLAYRIDLRAAPDATARAAAPAAAVYGQEHYATVAKGALDTRVGHPVDQSSGGPDAFGHRWTDSREPGGPAFAWTDISATGRRLAIVSACDDCSEEAPLSFPFPFYGSAGFASVFVASNGYVTFGAPSSAYGNHPIPSNTMPGNLVAALFEDLYPAGGGGIFFQDYGDRAVIQWKDVPDFQGTGTFDFQVVLRADGTVDLFYHTLTGAKNTATVGIQDASGTDGLGVVYNADFLQDSLAVRLRTFVTVAGRIGHLAGLGEATLPVSLDSRGLAPGTYQATLGLSGSADFGKAIPAQDVPVELTVTPAPGAAKR